MLEEFLILIYNVTFAELDEVSGLISFVGQYYFIIILQKNNSMAFAKAVIRQVGRDLGKVISNQVFKDRHSTPYRRVGNRNRSQQAGIQQQNSTAQTTKVEALSSVAFDQAIGFSTTYTAPTMVRKLTGVYEVIKNEIFKASKDGYLDSEEAKLVFNMEQEFHHKAEVITDLLELDEKENEKHLEKLEKVVRLTSGLFHETLDLAIKGAKIERDFYLEKQKHISPIDFKRFIYLHSILMGNYAKTGKKQMSKTIIANLISFICIFIIYVPILNVIGLFQGLLGYSAENASRNFKIKQLQHEADLEEKRLALYKEVKKDTENLAKGI